MLYAFRRSRFSFYGILCISLVIALAVWFRDRGYPFFVPLIASLLTLCLGYVCARLLGNILAGSENTRILGYLHMELDPDKFITAYEQVPTLIKGKVNAAVCRSYLADGYAARGDYEQAISLLSQEPPADQLALQGLYAANLASCHLWAGHPAEARQKLDRLQQIIDACRLDKASLARNLTEMEQLHRQHLACLTGQDVDTGLLEESFTNAQYNLRRLEIKAVLARAALRDGSDATPYLAYLRKQGGKTIYSQWAASCK